MKIVNGASNPRRLAGTSLRRFLLFFLPSCVVLLGLTYAFARLEAAYEIRLLRAAQQALLLREKRSMEGVLQRVAGDARMLAQSPVSLKLAQNWNRQLAFEAERLFLAMAANRPRYQQIRFIAADGWELVRVDQEPRRIFSVGQDKLQNKARRYYVSQGLRIAPGKVYLSRLDLNMERGQVEKPFKPMLRFVAPVPDDHGRVGGLVAINYLAGPLLEKLKQAGGAGRLAFVDSRGWWLLGPSPGQQWGFMLPGRERARLDLAHPKLWRTMQAAPQGQMMTRAGLYTYTKIDSPAGYAGETGWFMLSLVAKKDFNQVAGQLKPRRLAVLAALMAALALACWLLSQAQIKRLKAEIRLHKDAENQKALSDLLGLRLSDLPLAAILEQALKIVLGVSWLSTLPKGGVFLNQEENPPVLRLAAHLNLDAEIVKLCSLVPWGRCHCGLAAQSGRLQYCPHVTEAHHNRYQGMQDHGHYNLPLTKGPRCLGVMVLYLPPGKQRLKEEELFLQTVGGILAGILDSREKEDALAASQARLAAVVDTAVEGIVTIDSRGTVLSFNQAAERIFGYRDQEVVGRNVAMLAPEPVSSQHDQYIRRYLETGQAHIIGIGREAMGRRKDDSLFPLYLSVAEICQGDEVLFTGILRDITEEKDAQRRLEKAKEQTELANRQLEEKQRLLDRDMAAAAGIQQALLPMDLSRHKGLGLALRFMPSQHIGGDMLSVQQLSPDHIGIYLLDVSGHGVPSALVTVSVHEMLLPNSGHVVQYMEDGSAHVAEPRWVADMLDQEYPLERFDKHFSLFYAVLNLTDGRLAYTNAGHPPPFLLRQRGPVEPLMEGGTVIGMNMPGGFEQGETILNPGDRLFLYTDGLTEHASPVGELFGENRLRLSLERGLSSPLEDWVGGVLAQVMAWGEGKPPEDDLSMLAAEYLGER